VKRAPEVARGGKGEGLGGGSFRNPRDDGKDKQLLRLVVWQLTTESQGEQKNPGSVSYTRTKARKPSERPGPGPMAPHWSVLSQIGPMVFQFGGVAHGVGKISGATLGCTMSCRHKCCHWGGGEAGWLRVWFFMSIFRPMRQI